MTGSGGHFDVIPEKPNLSLYLRQRVDEILKGNQPWEWAIRLKSGVCIINKDDQEVFPPDDFLAEKKFIFTSFSMSVRDTTLHFQSPETGHIVKFSLSPTKYAVHDPVHGGEVYPQWPEELEEMGIPSVEGGEISEPPPADWGENYSRLQMEADQRRAQEAQEFIKEEGEEPK